MNLFILRWNPNISSYKTKSHLELISHIRKNEQPVDFNWSIREHEQLAKGDMFILQQVGTENDGIAMIGKFKNTCYEDDSWRKDGSKLYYADMWIMDAFDCNGKNPLPAKRYEKLFPQIEWHSGHSGVVADEDLDDKLITQIENDLIKARIWMDGELDNFMAWDFDKEDESEKTFLIKAKEKYLKKDSKKNFINLIGCLMVSKVLMPMHVEKDEAGEEKFFPMLLSDNNEETAYPIFSNEEQLNGHYQEDDCEIYEIPISVAIEIIKDDNETLGLILDPFTKPFLIDKDIEELITQLENDYEKNEDSEDE